MKTPEKAERLVGKGKFMFDAKDIANAVYWYLKNSNCGNPDCECCGKRDRNIQLAFEDAIV